MNMVDKAPKKKKKVPVKNLICPKCKHRHVLKETKPTPYCHGKLMVTEDI